MLRTNAANLCFCLVILLFVNRGWQMMSMMIELFKRFPLRFGVSAFLRFAPKIKSWRALLVQMEQVLFIVSISSFLLMKKITNSKFVLNLRALNTAFGTKWITYVNFTDLPHL